jgi:hypothetical protein
MLPGRHNQVGMRMEIGLGNNGASEKTVSMRDISDEPVSGTVYSFCTLVTDVARYRAMVGEFVGKGFTEADSEFLYLDNSGGNRFDAYAGYNLFLRAARGTYVILCHQDIRLLSDGRDRLDAVITELNSLDPRWGLFGNAGGLHSGARAIRISDPHGDDVAQGGPFPVACQTLDENFIVVRAAANLSLSGDLSGFHLYGTDMCAVAAFLGYTAYVVDFHLRHEGRGRIDDTFTRAAADLVHKYARTMQPIFFTTTCARLVITPSPFVNRISNTRQGLNFIRLAANAASIALRWAGGKRRRSADQHRR